MREKMRLANTLESKYIIENLTATTKDGAVDELLNLLNKDIGDIDLSGVKESITERENIENTSYGRGFAFPHARTDAVDDMYVLLGISKSGLSDETPDGVPLSVVVLLLTPSHISKLYLQTLSAFATFARIEGNLDKIKEAKSKDGVIEIIRSSGVSVEKELRVKDIMRRDVETIRPEASLKDVANQMFRRRLSALAVVDDEGRLLGQIEDKDLIMAALPDYKTLISNLNYSLNIEPFEELLKQEDSIKVSELFKTNYEVTSADTKIVEVAAMMIFKDVRRVFVVEGKKLVGILLRKDIVSTIIRG
jgi:mannitol/fructose-specific phosphotransferase system IIA component (Ntr-type)/CBS domain-containing protein